MVGSIEAEAIYVGSTLIWSPQNQQQQENEFPNGYKLLEYIAGDTNWSFIDTGIQYNSNLKVECNLQDNEWKSYGAFFGAYDSESSPSLRLIYTNQQIAKGYYTAGSIASQSMEIGVDSIGSKRHIILDKDGVNVNGTYTANIRTITSASLNRNIMIGSTKDGGKPGEASTRILKIYNFKIWNNNVLVFNGIPAMRLSDNTPGLYDTISNRLLQPYWPEGSFTAGPEIVEIEYLRSSGTQYIDLNIVPDIDTGLYIKTQISNSADSQYAIGLRDTSGDTRWCIGCTSSNGWSYGYGKYTKIAQDSNKNYICEITLNYLNNGSVSIVATEGSGTKSLSTLDFTPQNKIRLFGSSGQTGTYTKFKGDIYNVKISQGSQIVYDLIPVRVGQVGYMYDKISGTLLGNDSTGDFVLGPDKNN